MNKVNRIIFLVAIACFYAILTIKLDIFWKIGDFEKAYSFNDIILNISYSILAAVIFYIFIDVIPYYAKKKKMREVLRTKIDGIKQDINSAKTAIYLPPFTEMAKTKDGFANDFENKNMKDSYRLGLYPFNSLIEYFEHNKKQIRNSILEVLAYSNFLTEKEVEILADINSSKYINRHFFIKDFENLLIQPDLFNNQREIGNSIYSINELIKKL